MGGWKKTALNPGILTAECEGTAAVSSVYRTGTLLGSKVTSVTEFLMVSC